MPSSELSRLSALKRIFRSVKTTRRESLLLGMVKNQEGFHLIPVLIIVIVLVVGFVGWNVIHKNKPSNTSQPQTSTSAAKENKDPNTPPVKLKTIGVNLDYYDSATNHAGDFIFTKSKVNLDRIFLPFGQVIPGNSSNDNQDKTDPQAELRLPMGTKVHSLVDGYVAAVPKLYSDDYSVQVSAVKDEMNWLYETEHVVNVLVKPGDKVMAGQVIAEVSPHSKDSYSGLGVVELGILHGGNPPQHVCPFAYLDDSIKEATLAKLKAFMKSWEDYRGDQTLYDEKMPLPGCLTLDALDG